MTCIVGCIDKSLNKVIIGGDSAESFSSGSIIIRKDHKVFKKDDFIIGCTSSFRMIQLLKYKLILPKITDSTDIYQYMCTDFVDSVRRCFSDGGFLFKNENYSELGGTFLVGYKDRLFKIEDDFQVAESLNEYDSIGSGADFAIGALFNLSDKNILPVDKVLKALITTEYFALGVKRPFIILDTSMSDKYIKDIIIEQKYILNEETKCWDKKI